MTPTAKLATLLAFVACSACGANLRQVSASSSDYADYRTVRLAPTIGGRLHAADAYLRCRPEGAFRDTVQEWFDRIEPLFFEAAAGSASGMQAYLDALPTGPHAASATQRRDALIAAARAEAGERLAARAAEIERRLAKAAQGREDLLAAYASWIGRLLDYDAWGRVPDDVNADFASAWSGEPKAKCGPDACTKLLSMPYELEVRGKPQAFVGILEVSLKLAKGRVVEASISGPDLFSRLAEAQQVEPVTETSEGRARALKNVVQLTAGALERRLESARCSHEATAPSVMVRECDGYKVDVVPKGAGGGEDRVVIRGPGKL